MTDQEIYDTVLFGLRKQGHASVIRGTCQYRGPNGDKCAAGMLMPDEQYSPAFEGIRINDSEIWPALELDDSQKPLVSQLQLAHDAVLALQGVFDWEMKMQGIAIEYGLTYTPAQVPA